MTPYYPSRVCAPRHVSSGSVQLRYYHPVLYDDLWLHTSGTGTSSEREQHPLGLFSPQVRRRQSLLLLFLSLLHRRIDVRQSDRTNSTPSDSLSEGINAVIHSLPSYSRASC
jgi:hypothetical protein